MNQGVEILLSRMDSNPDEFVTYDGSVLNKWGWVMDDLRRRISPTKEDKEHGYVPLRFLTDDEVRTLWDKMESLRADQFTRKVMSTLLEEEEINPFMSAFAAAPVKTEGKAIRYSGFGSDIEIPYIPIKTKGRYIK